MQALQLDITGMPQAWISVEEAASHIVTGSVAWHLGDEPLAVLRGGTNAKTGRQSVIEIPPILALTGASRVNLFDLVPVYSKSKILRRDRSVCCYCGEVFPESILTVDHIIPESRGGKLSWINTCCACRSCNSLKADRTPEEAGMPLLYMPYVPSRVEDFILKGRNIRADVHEWLAAKLPRHSRLH